MIIYHTLKYNGKYEVGFYDLKASFLAFRNSKIIDLIKFLCRSRFTKKGCEKLCNKLNNNEKKRFFN